jgi:hypothetical protein
MKLYDAIKTQAAAGKPQRIIVLKARQMGFSTLTEAIIFKKTATSHNVSSAVVTQKEEATTNLFEMSKRYYNHLPEPLKPQLKASNAKELLFDTRDGRGLNSRIKCFTAGGEAIGRSDTIQNLHASEYAFWNGEKKITLNGLLQAVPNTKNSLVVIESTANGFDHFKELWDMAVEGKNDFCTIFCAWWEMPEYRMSAHSIESLTPDERKQKELYNLDNEQIAWRRWCIANNCGGDENLFKQEYPANPAEAFLSTGDCFFDLSRINEREVKACQQPKPKCGYFAYDSKFSERGECTISNIRWVASDNGYIKIHKEPTKDGQYALGADPSGEGSDYYAGVIINAKTCEQQAELFTNRMELREYAEQLYCLAHHYNKALIGAEVNFDAYITQLLANINGAKQYIRENAPDKIKTTRSDSYGFKTTSATRPAILSAMKIIVHEDMTVINSTALLSQMRTFVRNKSGKYEALSGKHDDLVMAYAIACEIRTQALKGNISFGVAG